jgi:hypothetical protein
MGETEFANVFSALRSLLARHAPRLDVMQDTASAYTLNAAYSERWKKVIFFGAVQINKNYVSYHLFPVYMFPDLLDSISPQLRKRMQGKNCFNFKSLDGAQQAELDQLTERAFRRFEAEGLIGR